MTTKSVYEDHAFKLVRQYGYTEALRICAKDRDNNSPGSVSFAFHQAVMKYLRRFATVGALDD